MQPSLWLEQLHCSFRAAATSEGWKGSCQRGSLPGRAVRRGAQAWPRGSSWLITGTQVVSLRAPQRSFGRYSAHSQNCTLDRCFSVCSIYKFLGNGKFGVCVSCLYYMSAEMSLGWSRAIVRRLTGTMHHHAPGALLTALHFNVSATDAAACDPSVLSW